MTSRRNYRLAVTTTLIVSAVISGCGGGGGGSEAPSIGASPAQAQTISGVTAAGAALANASITLTDAQGSPLTTTSDASGRYTFNVSGLVAPFVIVATGNSGDGTTTLVSVAPIAPQNGGTATVNVTPLTTALAAALDATGDPLHLAANMATQAANITTTALNTAQANLRGSLSNVLTALGLPNTTDFVSGTLVANGTGVDQLLDSVQVSVAPGGTAAGGTTLAVKDGNGTVTSANVNLATEAATGLTLTTPANYSVLSGLQPSINACIAVTPSTARSTAAACTSLFTGDYLNNGSTTSQELAQFNTAALDNAAAEAPQVVYYVDATHAIVKLVLVLADGSRYGLTTMAENSANTGHAWKLRGNQKAYYALINGMAQWINQLNVSAALLSAFTSGLNLYFDATAGAAATTFGAGNPNSYVLVTGPGLPSAGVVLKTSGGTCPYLTITSESGNTGSAHKNTCASYFRLTGTAAYAAQQSTFVNVFKGLIAGGGTASALHNQNYADGMVPDAMLKSITPFSAYTIKIHDGNANTDTVYTEHLRSRPLTAVELPNVRWTYLSAASQGLLFPSAASTFGGGTSMALTWTPPAYGPRVSTVNVQIRAGGVVVGSNTRTPTSVNGYTAMSGTAFPAVTSMTSTPANGDFSWVSLIARDSNDLQIQSVNQYAMN